MNKLFCYGITRRALQLLGPDSPSEIPNAWFNWLNQNFGGTAIERLTLIDPDSSAAKVLNWNRNAKEAGYACVLIYSTEDPSQHTDHAKTLSEDVVLHPISHMPTRSERDGQVEVLSLLREPENFFINGWALVRGGGGVSIDKRGLADVPPAHWWAYGIGLKKWINRTAKGQPGSVHRNNCPDFAPWNHMKAIGLEYPDTKLSIQKCWNSPKSDFWPWSLSNPCTPTDIPAMSPGGFVAYYPMRQMPCCGVAVTESGELVSIGALPDQDASGNWAWDDGSIRKAFTNSKSFSINDAGELGSSKALDEIQTGYSPALDDQMADTVKAWVLTSDFMVRLKLGASQRVTGLLDENDGYRFVIAECSVKLDQVIPIENPEYETLQFLTLKVIVYGSPVPVGSTKRRVKIALKLVGPPKTKLAQGKTVGVAIVSGQHAIAKLAVTARLQTCIVSVHDENLVLQIHPLDKGGD